MSKGKIITISIFLLSLGAVLGGWYLTRALLEQRREAILGRTGEIPLQSAGSSLFSRKDTEADENDIAGESSGSEFFQGEAVSEEMMARVLTVWARGGRVLPHEPKQGQMNMEQAIGAGREWIAAMAEHGVLLSDSTEGEFNNITARLCTLEGSVDFDEKLVSYWSMKFIADDMEINLTLHAMSGEIWSASIIMNEKNCLWNEYEPEDLLNYAFPFMKQGNQILIDTDGYITSVSLSEGLVLASVSRVQMQFSDAEPLAIINFRLSAW